ncbi:protein-lysine N-methyltransferase CG9154 [Anopheles nili]|uniref:protein-lysine N-methyltransferase CG9154 n=1 Tax=Anopheles nili TaxID=185578 RepID=UPI00237A15BA|nr:protein-lysine N-methyltransferase CG9154 [Anopheles nili]
MTSTNPNISEESETISDDESCVLPADTMLILQQFLEEKALKDRSTEIDAESAECFEENWQLSQFWYNEATKQKVAFIVKSLQEASGSSTYKVALLSVPSVFKHVSRENHDVILFEYDERFACYGDRFHQYDYNKADEPGYMDMFGNHFDLVIADPPFLSEECIEKVGKIIKKILKQNGKIILCSGSVVQHWAMEHMGVSLCQLKPEHERNLGNEFRSYANFDLDSFFNKEK